MIRILIVDNSERAEQLKNAIEQNISCPEPMQVLCETNEREVVYRVEDENIDIVAIGLERTMLHRQIRYSKIAHPYILRYYKNDAITDILETIQIYISPTTVRGYTYDS